MAFNWIRKRRWKDSIPRCGAGPGGGSSERGGACELIVLAHSRLVAKTVLDVNGAPTRIFFQEGIVGPRLHHAVPVDTIIKFSTYATYWIRYFIQRAQAGINWEVKVPLRRSRGRADPRDGGAPRPALRPNGDGRRDRPRTG